MIYRTKEMQRLPYGGTAKLLSVAPRDGELQNASALYLYELPVSGIHYVPVWDLFKTVSP